MTQPARRLPAVLAAVLAMVASVMALASIVVSDIAEARERATLEEADDVSDVPPVMMKKVQVKAGPSSDELVDPFEPLKQPRKKKKGVSFGRFEGY